MTNNIAKFRAALEMARDYITSDLASERGAFEGHEGISRIDEINADLANNAAAIAALAELERTLPSALKEKLASADARIAELEQAVTVRDTEIARLETDLELARIEVKRLRDALDQSALEYADLAVSAKSLEDHLHALVEVSEDSTIARARAVMNGDDIGEDEDAARAGNGGGV